MYKLTLRWAIAMIVLVFGPANWIHAQKSWETIPVYEGLQVKNEMLVFSSKNVFDQVYQDLEQRTRQWYADPNGLSPEESPDQPCPDDNAVLAIFGRRYPINSIGQVTRLMECEWLEAGRDPAAFEGHHLVDEILGALFNDRYQLQVGKDIYYLPNSDMAYIVGNEDLAALRLLEKGENPYNLPNVQVRGPESGCSAEFSVNTDYSSTTVGFAFTGQPQMGTVLYFWEFGDGSVSMQKNPVHTYASAGIYDVCLTIETTGSQNCVNRVCKKVQVGAGGCQPFFIYNETGQPGGICFLDNTQFLQNVVSWTWDFGDGSPGSNQPNPCHTFPCDKTYFVSLSIQTSSGCTGFITLPVDVNSYQCCSNKAKKVDNHYYANNKKRLRYDQRHIQIPLLYYRVVSSITHYTLKSNGKWKKEAANLKIDLMGDVFLPKETGCKCENPFNIAKMELAFNKKSMTTTRAIGKPFKARKTQEWKAAYTVNNVLLTQQITPVACD